MILQSKKVWIRDMLRPAQICVEGGKITKIQEYGLEQPDRDYGDKMILPGFIDSHTHGHKGVDSMTANTEEYRIWQKEIVKEGVTSFAIATDTVSEADNIAMLERTSEAVGGDDCAEILSIYIEGNFINTECRGAHNEKLIAPPNVEQLKKYIKAANGTLKRMILAVELDKDFEVLKYALEHGIAVSLGHSAAPYEVAKRAIELGADGLTHVYNGMKQFHHREPSLVGIAFNEPNVYAEIIADGHHVCWPAVQTLCKAKDENHLVLVTDASPYKGYDGPLQEGVYIDEEGQFRTLDGSLCSSSLKMNEGVRNLIFYGQASFTQAINSATINPARMLGVDDRKGSIKEGKDADIVVVDDEFEVLQCYCRGTEML